MQIGEVAYNKFKSGEATFPEAEEMGEKIDGFLDDIKGFEEKILRLKHVRVCPDCYEEVEDTVAFCSKCGHKFEPLPVEEEEEEETEDDTPKCKSCGAEMDEGAAFCGKCGAKVE